MYLLSSNDLDIRIDIDLYIDVDTYIYIHTHTHSQNKPSCGQWVKRRSSRCPTGGGDSEACWLLCLLSLLSFLLYSSAPLRHEPHSATNPEPGTLNPRTTSPKPHRSCFRWFSLRSSDAGIVRAFLLLLKERAKGFVLKAWRGAVL